MAAPPDPPAPDPGPTGADAPAPDPAGAGLEPASVEAADPTPDPAGAGLEPASVEAADPTPALDGEEDGEEPASGEAADADAPAPRRGPPWPDYTPPRREPPVIPPREPTSRHRGFLKPQHRLTLFLLAGAAGTLLITLLFPPKPEVAGATAGPPSPPQPMTWPRERGATVALPAPEEAGDAPLAADLDAAMARVVPAVQACAATHAAALAPLDGALRLRLEVGPGGLTSAVLLDVAEVAEAPAACLAAAAWDAGWPADLSPQAVTLPFYVVAPLDGAPAPGALSPPGAPDAPALPPEPAPVSPTPP